MFVSALSVVLISILLAGSCLQVVGCGPPADRDAAMVPHDLAGCNNLCGDGAVVTVVEVCKGLPG